MVLFHISYWLIRTDFVHFRAWQIQTCLTTSQASLTGNLLSHYGRMVWQQATRSSLCVCERERACRQIGSTYGFFFCKHLFFFGIASNLLFYRWAPLYLRAFTPLVMSKINKPSVYVCTPVCVVTELASHGTSFDLCTRGSCPTEAQYQDVTGFGGAGLSPSDLFYSKVELKKPCGWFTQVKLCSLCFLIQKLKTYLLWKKRLQIHCNL